MVQPLPCNFSLGCLKPGWFLFPKRGAQHIATHAPSPRLLLAARFPADGFQEQKEDRRGKKIYISKKIPADSHFPSLVSSSHCFAVQVFLLSLYQGTGLDRSLRNQITDFYLFNFSSQHVGWRTDTRRGPNVSHAAMCQAMGSSRHSRA